MSSSYNIALSAMILWSVWKQRNDKTFRGSLPSPTATILQASQYLAEYLTANQKLPQSRSEHGPRHPKVASNGKRPPQGLLKINSDAAWSPERKVGSISCVVRDHIGKLLTGHARNISTYSPIVAEALAVRKAAMMAYNLNCEKVIFESDNLPLVEACRGECVIAEIELILKDVRTLTTGLLFSGFTWVRREGNKVAHMVAQECS
ncbi:Ribonuclease H-like superfamily [Sesbania bispinosa]|nr:Ribonuclease H-like superfamily [Sesbania bispinosa]